MTRLTSSGTERAGASSPNPVNEGARIPSSEERLAALARPDKWFLSGLDGWVWAPPFPDWLDHPGFWDPAHLFHYPFGPLFSVALLDEAGREIELTRLPSAAEAWRPDRLTVAWALGSRAKHRGRDPEEGSPGQRASQALGGEGRPRQAIEERRVLPGGVFESRWRLPAAGIATVATFTAQPAAETGSMSGADGRVTWTRAVQDRKGERLELECVLSLEVAGRAPGGSPTDPDRQRALPVATVIPSQGKAQPRWSLSPFSEGAGDRLAPVGTHPDDQPAWLWGATRASTDPTSPVDVIVRLEVRPHGPIPGQEGIDWHDFFSAFPTFSSGDRHLDCYFDARVFGLGLNRVAGEWPNVPHPAIAEGIEYFHVPITYSAQCHMMEMRWRAGGREAWGSLLNFLSNQRDDGSLHGRLYPNHLTGTDYYHANWGDGVRAVFALHPDRDHLARAYRGLTRFADWLGRERDPEGSGMFTVVNHYETGQEYMSRYVAVDPDADVNEWLPRLRLKGVDVTVYAHQLFRALEWMAGELGHVGDGGDWAARAAKTGDAIREHMWSPEGGIFTDVDGSTGRRTDIKAAVGFYPLLTDLPTAAQAERLLAHLADPSTFGTPFPIPSSSVDDPYFSAEGLWKGMRRNCPWNGRVWPMTTSHLIEALLRRWMTGDGQAGEWGVSILTRFVRMMCDDGDPDRPNCFEHYNPYTGRACYFRGIDDYQHSWVIDLMIRGFAGFHASGEGVSLHPLPHDLPRVTCGPISLRGEPATVETTPDLVRLRLGRRTWDGPRGKPLTISWREIGIG